MPDTTCTLRLGATATSNVPSILRDVARTFTAEFRDAAGAVVDVSGVTARLWYPSGAEVSPAPTPAETSAGIWTVSVDPEYEGLWRLQVIATTPSESSDEMWFRVYSAEPDDGPPPSPSYIEAATLMTRAETAADAAEAAQAAAEAAASSSLGPMTATSVGGTPDGNGDVLTYTCTLPAVLQLGAEVDFTPTAKNAAAPRLRPTVLGVLQGQTSIRDEDGEALGRHALIVGKNYRLHHDGTYLRAQGVTLSPRLVKATSATIYLYAVPGDADGYGRLRLRALEDGEIICDSGDGTEATGWTSRWAFIDGAFRVYGQEAYVGPAALGEDARVLTDHHTPLVARRVKNLIGRPMRANNRTSPQRLVISAPEFYQLGGIDQHRDIEIASGGTGTILSAEFFPKGAECRIWCAAGAVVHLYTGEGEWVGNGVTAASLTPFSWVNTGGKLLSSSAGAWLRVRRGNTTFLAIADTGSLSAATKGAGGVTKPAPSLIVAGGNQSWAVDFMENGAAGLKSGRIALGLGGKVYVVPSGNVGGSPILDFAAKTTLAHWDQVANQPKQRLEDMIAALIADRVNREAWLGLTPTAEGTNAPAPDAMVWIPGLTDLSEFGPSTTHPNNCPQVWTASFVKCCQAINAALGADIVHGLVGLTAQKIGTFGTSDDPETAADEMACWHAMRMAQQRCVAAGAAALPPVTIVILSDIYGDARSLDDTNSEGERHYDFPVVVDQAERFAHDLDNALGLATHHTGAEITAVASADSGAGREWDVTIDYGEGRSFNQAKRPHAAGFRLLPAATASIDADDWATPLTIVSTRWVAGTGTTIKLRCLLDAPYLGGTPRPSVLWGPAEATDELETVIFTQNPDTGQRFYLRQYLSGG